MATGCKAANIKNVLITATNEISHIGNEEVEEKILKYIKKAKNRKITDILLFIISGLVEQNVLNINNLGIYIYISGNGHKLVEK
ncbi:hypothetical protein C2G38_2203250 [Gigaspora rosea]|uniref:Uncharacterized protein n=1 Tax=Gigaspora rosea TaxID=44941 RepID=A0A397UMY0_9GLOM|nr:hypothetical protein C2G38_2203250 [Gigaspora rosea]